MRKTGGGSKVSPQEWVRALRRVEKSLLTISREWSSKELLEFLRVRVGGAAEIIARSDEKIGSIIIKGSGATAIIASTKFLEKRPVRLVKVITPDGEELRVPVGSAVDEEFHITQVGPYGMKCTCEDAVMTASRADREFIRALREAGIHEIPPTLVFPLFSRFVICKHTLAILSYLVAARVLSLKDLNVRRTLKLALVGALLKSAGSDEVGEGLLLEVVRELLKEGDG